MSLRDGYKFVAGGVIYPSRFVYLYSSDDSTVLQPAAANTRCLGISQPGTEDAPGLNGATAYAASADLDPIMVFLPGDIAPLEIGSGGVSTNDLIKCDATGKGIVAASTGQTTQWVSAIALEAGAAGEIVNVLVIPPTPYTPTVS